MFLFATFSFLHSLLNALLVNNYQVISARKGEREREEGEGGGGGERE